MSAVRLDRYRVERGNLPYLCMRCGAPATEERGKTFSKARGWTFFTIFLGAWPYFLMAALFRDRLRVNVPLCDKHQNHFRWQAAILWGGVAVLLALLAGCFALIPHVTDAVLNKCFLGVGILAAVWLVVLAVNRFTAITAATVSDRDAVIVGVANRFAKAYEAGEVVGANARESEEFFAVRR